MFCPIIVPNTERAGTACTLIITLWGGIRSEIVVADRTVTDSDQDDEAFNPHRRGSGIVQQVFSETSASEKTYRVRREQRKNTVQSKELR